LHHLLLLFGQSTTNKINQTLAMQLFSMLCAFYLLNCYQISAHPNLYPEALEKRGIEGVAIGTQVHSLHKRMEGSSQSMSTTRSFFL
jgi:hypothetical protein